MEFFANALEDYYLNTINSKYILYRHCVQKEYNGGKWEVELKNYFRTWDNLWPLERKLINLSYGNILDIGSCTGYYIPYFMEKGTAMGMKLVARGLAVFLLLTTLSVLCVEVGFVEAFAEEIRALNGQASVRITVEPLTVIDINSSAQAHAHAPDVSYPKEANPFFDV
ncbi:hypothetical protein LCGC14_1091880 [marine sediment metagenome]|uniref:Uncharacterized protein n=1 Tax=marine sediment metagenome TaxID=412755 RepID=A0A0F9MC60_9ZZZZ